MKKIKYSFMVVFFLSFVQTLPITKQQDNFLKRQYKSLKSDLELIKKCYGTISPACTDNERKEARKAALRVGGKISGVVGAVLLISGLGGWWYVRFKQPDEDDEDAEAQAQQVEAQKKQLEALQKSVREATKIEIVEIKKVDDSHIEVIVASDVEVTPPQLIPYEESFAQLFRVAYPSVRIIDIKNPTTNKSYPIMVSK